MLKRPPYKVVVSSTPDWQFYQPRWSYRVLTWGTEYCLASGGGYAYGLEALAAGEREAEYLHRARVAELKRRRTRRAREEPSVSD